MIREILTYTWPLIIIAIGVLISELDEEIR